MTDFNTQVIEEFSADAGNFDGAAVVIITTTGARSGRLRTRPLVYLPDVDRVVIFASKASAPTNPDRYHDITANPRATVEVGAETGEAVAEEITGEERGRLAAAHVAVMPGFQTYAESTTRLFPVVALKCVG